MAEYIEREAAIAAAFSAKAVGNSAYRDVYDTVSRLRLIPTADVRENVRGHWNDNDTCSVCGDEPLFEYDLRILNFCPNCGAKMDEVIDDG